LPPESRWTATYRAASPSPNIFSIPFASQDLEFAKPFPQRKPYYSDLKVRQVPGLRLGSFCIFECASRFANLEQLIWSLMTSSEHQMAIPDRYQTLLQSTSAFGSAGSIAQALDVLSGTLLKTINFDTVALLLSRGAPVAGHAWYLLSRNTDNPQFAAQRLAPVEGQIGLRAFERNEVVPREQACAVPLATPRGSIGSITFSSNQPDAYSEDEVRFLALVGAQIGLVLLSLMDQADARGADRLQVILEINNKIASNLELYDLLRSVSGSVRNALRCDAAGISIPEGEHLRLHSLDFPGAVGAAHEGLLIPIKGSMLGDVFVSRKAARHHIAQQPQIPMEAKERLRFGCACPLFGRNRTLGVLSAARVEDKPFSEEDLALLVQISKQVAIALDNSLAYGEINELKEQLAREKVYLEDEIRTEMQFHDIVGNSSALRNILQQVEIVAPTDSTVLIYGETGTGKELIARAVHDLSSRKARAFVKLNCAAIPTGLLESELFGHEKGAFTGAIAQRIGRFELAHGGTVFLDEIGEIPLELQPKLLRVLQEREFERLGASRTLRTDARLIAATNRDLAAMAQENKFRPDLYYRLNVFPIRVPSLRERAEDIPLLVRHFVQQFGRRMGKAIESVPADTMDALVDYHWPGNIRELQNVIERAVIVTQGPVLKVALGELVSIPRTPAPTPREDGNMRKVLEETEREQIVRALEQANWVISGDTGAAARLGMKRSTLQARMQKLGIQITRTGGNR
jgi:formate hydrogenlyase transcriptional activator